MNLYITPKLLRNISLFVFISISSVAKAQVVGNVQAKGLDMQAAPFGFIAELPMAPGETTGDVYLYVDWRKVDISLYNSDIEVKDYPVRIDLQENILEIDQQGKIRALAGDRVREFIVADTTGLPTAHFINAKDFRLEGVPLIGFFGLVATQGNWTILSRVDIKFRKSTYVSALDAGDRNNELVKEKRMFIAFGERLYLVTGSTKKFCSQFENPEHLQNFIKQSKINLKNPADLPRLLIFLSDDGK